MAKQVMKKLYVTLGGKDQATFMNCVNQTVLWFYKKWHSESFNRFWLMHIRSVFCIMFTFISVEIMWALPFVVLVTTQKTTMTQTKRSARSWIRSTMDTSTPMSHTCSRTSTTHLSIMIGKKIGTSCWPLIRS